MNKWEHTLDFRGFYRNDKLLISEKARRVSLMVMFLIGKLKPSGFMDDPNCSIVDVSEEFEGIDNVADFDCAMDVLYDFADDYRIWIRTV